MEHQNSRLTSEPADSTSEPTSPSVGSFLWELIRVVLVAFAIMLVVRLFLAEPFIVSGSSMVPNFHNKEYLIINKLGYRLDEPRRGDVVVFKYPRDPSQYFIKRVIGLPGEKVQIREGRVVVFNLENPDGIVMDEPYLKNVVTSASDELVALASDEYYVLGDNRPQSSDSRVWGALPKNLIVGKAWLRVFPLPEFGTIHHPSLDI